MAMIRLYTYFRSSAAFRVRIALHYKGLPFEAVPVHLLRGGGEQHSAAFAERNPARHLQKPLGPPCRPLDGCHGPSARSY